MLSADEIERVGKRPNVRSADERGVPAIAQRPIETGQFHRCQTAASAAQIRSGYAERASVATVISLRCDVVENAVEARIDLVHGVRRKQVRFGNSSVTRVIGDALVARKRALFGESRSAA